MGKIQDILRVEGINCKGFGIIPKAIMLDSELSIEAKTIYAYFCSLAGNGTTTFPRRDTILRHLKISKNYYYKNFKQLLEQGFITCERSSTFPYNNIYTLISNPKKYIDNEMQTTKSISYIKYTGLKSYGFGVIPRVVMMDDRLDIKAKGIYAYFCSYVGSGVSAFPAVKNILFQLKIGHQAYYKYYRQLIMLNYISSSQRIENGKFGVCDYYINEFPDSSIDQVPKYTIKNSNNLTDKINKIAEVRINTEEVLSDDLEDNDKINKKYTVFENDDWEDNVIEHNVERYNYNINNININNIKNKNNQSIILDRLIEKTKIIRNTNIVNYTRLVLKNIDYNFLKNYPNQNIELLDNIVDLLLETINTKKEKIRICGENKNSNIVKSKLLKLNCFHIQYVIDSILNNSTRIKNIESYILTALYKAPMTMTANYINLANSTI